MILEQIYRKNKIILRTYETISDSNINLLLKMIHLTVQETKIHIVVPVHEYRFARQHHFQTLISFLSGFPRVTWGGGLPVF